MSKIAKFKNLTYWYPGSKEPAIKNIDVEIGKGEFTLVVGSSGCGKSTFLRCFNGLTPHFTGGKIKGKISICGQNPLEKTPKNMAKHVGMVFQDPENQLAMTTVENEIVFGAENLCMFEIKEKLSEILTDLNITHLAQRKLHDLSSGEKQKIVIASALIMQPKILVADEPTSQLDPKSADEILKLLKHLNESHDLSIVLSEHRIERIAKYCDMVFDMDQNNLGKPQQIPTKCTYLPQVSKPKKGKKIISIRNLTKSYGEISALKDINLDFYEGELAVIIGPNGCGKTTLIKHINGLLKTNSSQVTVFGKDIRKTPVETLAKDIAYLGQNPNDYLFCETVEDELKFTAKNLKVDGNITKTLKLMGLEQYKDKYPRDLSAGERQKVALASVLVSDPKIIILDEPTRGMDYNSKTNLMNFLKQSGKTIILVTHDIKLANEFTQRSILLDNGKLISN